MSIGETIKERRKSMGLSAEALADILGVSPATIYRYENGDIEKIPGERLGAIAIVLHTTPEHLLHWNHGTAEKFNGSHETSLQTTIK